MSSSEVPIPAPAGSEQLERLLAFETLLADLSAAFVTVPPTEVDELVPIWLERLVEFFDLDRSGVVRFRPDGSLEVTHSWARPGIEPAGEVPIERFTWYTEEVRRNRVIVAEHLPDDLPADAFAERDYVQVSGIRAHLGIPITIGGERTGGIGFAGFRQPRPWPPEVIRRVRIVGEVIGGALARKRAEEALRRSEARLRRVLESVPDALLLVRADGSVSFSNDAASDTFGFRRAELLDLPVARLVPSLEGAARTARAKGTEAVREISGLVGRHKDGSDLRLDVRIGSLGEREGEIVCLLRPTGSG